MSKRSQRVARRMRNKREQDELLDAEYEEPGPLLSAPPVAEVQPTASCFSPLARGGKKLWRKARSKIDEDYRERMALKDKLEKTQVAARRQLALLPVQEQRIQDEVDAAEETLGHSTRRIVAMKMAIKKLVDAGNDAATVKVKGANAFLTIKKETINARRAKADLARANNKMVVIQKKRAMIERTLETQLYANPDHTEDMELIAETSRDIGVDAYDAYFDVLEDLVAAGNDADRVGDSRIGDLVESINEAAGSSLLDDTGFEDDILAEIMAAGSSAAEIEAADSAALTITQLEALATPNSVPGQSRVTTVPSTSFASRAPRRELGASEGR